MIQIFILILNYSYNFFGLVKLYFLYHFKIIYSNIYSNYFKNKFGDISNGDGIGNKYSITILALYKDNNG